MATGWLQDGCSTEAGCLDNLILAQGITVYFRLRMPTLGSFAKRNMCKGTHILSILALSFCIDT